jgi:hypothetical protein
MHRWVCDVIIGPVTAMLCPVPAVYFAAPGVIFVKIFNPAAIAGMFKSALIKAK